MESLENTCAYERGHVLNQYTAKQNLIQEELIKKEAWITTIFFTELFQHIAKYCLMINKYNFHFLIKVWKWIFLRENNSIITLLWTIHLCIKCIAHRYYFVQICYFNLKAILYKHLFTFKKIKYISNAKNNIKGHCCL